MIAILIGSTVIGGLVVCWCGYKTLDRIQNWGKKMNELDAIFQSAATDEEMSRYARPVPNPGKADTVRPAGLPVHVPR